MAKQSNVAPAGTLREPVSIVMPVSNEANIITEVVDEWRRDVLAYLPEGSELVFDDCSSDGTEDILRELSELDRRIRVNFSERDGFFKAAMRLYRLARCPLIFFTDSDGQYVPAEFWKVAQNIASHDMVHGYKSRRKDKLYRKGASLIFNLLVHALFGSKNKDVNSAFRLIRRPMLEQLLDQIHCLQMMPNAEMYIRAEWQGFRIKNVPVRHRIRKHGKSRSLPLRAFSRECLVAYRGLRALRQELLAVPKPAPGTRVETSE